MAMAAIETDDMDRYLAILRSDADELDQLAKDLLINVTSFFRDAKVFDLLAEKIVPELVRDHSSDDPIRVWIAGCSTGEETYSLAILFLEAISAEQRNVKLQVFASDIDADAVATARDGRYPKTIEADVSPTRLAGYFFEGRSRLSRRLRICVRLVVFTVQDVLARSAVLADRPGILPQSADLPASRGTGESDLDVPFRAARRWHSPAGQLGDRRRCRWPV